VSIYFLISRMIFATCFFSLHTSIALVTMCELELRYIGCGLAFLLVLGQSSFQRRLDVSDSRTLIFLRPN
jgi:hypothetical protein